LLSLFLFAGTAAAQKRTTPDTAGAVVVIPAYGEVRHPNDEAHATFMVEEQDKDKAAAASRVNRKMKQGTEIAKKEDPQAILKTFGYYTYPVYSDEQIQPRQNKPRQPVGWRVGQYLEVRTTNLAALPKMAAATQQILALNGLQFGLTDATARKLEAQQIAAAYANLTDRIAAVAQAMGRSVADATMDTVDFEGSGAYAPQQERATKAMRSTVAAAMQVEEPSFEPGETTLSMRVVGKVRFK
jgi:predicted secreted protein